MGFGEEDRAGREQTKVLTAQTGCQAKATDLTPVCKVEGGQESVCKN